MAGTDPTRLAVLIDADNATASLAAELLEEIAKYGTPTIKRAYGDWTTQQLVGWKEELLRHAIQPVQQFAYTRGKNSTDSALIIDAMDLLYACNLEGFVIVSSDSDFTRLATRLRGIGDDGVRARARAARRRRSWRPATGSSISTSCGPSSRETAQPRRRAGAAAAQPQADPVDGDQQHVARTTAGRTSARSAPT